MRLIPIPGPTNHQCVVLSKKEANDLLNDLIGQLTEIGGCGSKTYTLNGTEVDENHKVVCFIIGKE